jgi:hypothetical protein
LDGVLGHLTKPAQVRSTSCTNGEKTGATFLHTPISAGTDQSDSKDIIIDFKKHDQHDTDKTSLYRGTWADRLGLDWWLMGHLLQRYRTMQHHFPFVVIPEAWDLQHMLTSRPVLLLAIVSSSACHFSQIQQILIKELKDTLTRRVMIGGENSLELLQAFLVHLAGWVGSTDYMYNGRLSADALTGHNIIWSHGVNLSTGTCRWLSVWQWTCTWIQTLASQCGRQAIAQAQPVFSLIVTYHWIVHGKLFVLRWVAFTCPACKSVPFSGSP